MPAKWQTWFPFYVDAFRGSPAVQAMHPAARAGYIYLLSAAWQSDDCTIPNDPLELAELSGIGDELWAAHGARILRKFEPVGDRLRNARLYEDWLEARRIFESRQGAACRTNQTRNKNARRTVTERIPDGDRAVTQTVSDQTATRSADTSTGTITGTHEVSDANASSPRRKADGEGDEDTCEFIYARYPRNVARGPALAAIRKAIGRLETGEGGQPMSVADAVAFLVARTESFADSPLGKRPDKSKIPHPATWFNQQRYLDDSEAWQHVSETYQQPNPNGSAARAERCRATWDRERIRPDSERGVPVPLQHITSPADAEAEERNNYTMWLSTSEQYRSENPWRGRVFA